MLSWLILIVAGLAEVGWVVGLKFTEGFTRFVPSVVTVLLMIMSFLLLSQAVKTIHVGTAYAVWVGIGASGAFLIGMVYFNEPRDLIRIGCVLLIVIGIIGLKFSDNTLAQESGAAGAKTIAVMTHHEERR